MKKPTRRQIKLSVKDMTFAEKRQDKALERYQNVDCMRTKF
jgi:hypothetical protein